MRDSLRNDACAQTTTIVERKMRNSTPHGSLLIGRWLRQNCYDAIASRAFLYCLSPRRCVGRRATAAARLNRRLTSDYCQLPFCSCASSCNCVFMFVGALSVGAKACSTYRARENLSVASTLAPFNLPRSRLRTISSCPNTHLAPQLI